MKTLNATPAKKAKVKETTTTAATPTKKVLKKKVTTPATEETEEKPKKLKIKKKSEEQPVKPLKKVAEKPAKEATKKVVREIKYIYPDDVVDAIDRKKFRAQARKKLRDLENKMKRLETADDKSYKAAQKAYNDYRDSILKA